MPVIETILKIYKANGLSGIFEIIKAKFPFAKIKSTKKTNINLKYFKGKKGIEIGGPSPVFLDEIPIYRMVRSLDGCNFSNQTIWEGEIIEGENYNYFKDKRGYQYICEANNLQAIPNESYDFLIASHCLEHCANTLLTIREWLRVVKKGGTIMLILPDKRYTFDHQRPVTNFEHLVDDLNKGIDETDLTHLSEILKLHDLTMDQPAGTKEKFKKRSLNNYENRCLHHHIFDFELLEKIYYHFEIKIADRLFVKPYHQIIIGVKQ